MDPFGVPLLDGCLLGGEEDHGRTDVDVAPSPFESSYGGHFIKGELLPLIQQNIYFADANDDWIYGSVSPVESVGHKSHLRR